MCYRILLLLTLLSLRAGHAQSCADTLRHREPYPANQTISVRLLRIPVDSKRHYEKAVAAAARQQLELSEQQAALALTDAPQFAEVYLLRAVMQLKAGRSTEALSLISTARTIEPDLAWASIAAASALNHVHRFEDAMMQLENIHGPEAASWQADYERARAETGRSNVVGALHWSELAVAAAPVGCTEARLVRANALHLAGRQHEVIAELQNFLTEDRVRTRHDQVLAALNKARAELQTDPAQSFVATR